MTGPVAAEDGSQAVDPGEESTASDTTEASTTNSLTSLPTPIAEYLTTRIATEREQYLALNGTPRPYDGAYRELLRARLGRDCLAKLGLGTGHQDRTMTVVTHDGERISVRADHVVAFLGSRMRTFKNTRSRAERWCGFKLWMDVNRCRWDDPVTCERTALLHDHQLYDILAAMFAPQWLPSKTSQEVIGGVAHLAITSSIRSLERRIEPFARRYELKTKGDLPSGELLVA